MLRQPTGARRYNDMITLTKAQVSVDDYGHPQVTGSEDVLEVYAYVRQMSATKTMLTFQQADVVGLDIEFRAVSVPFDGIVWKGHEITFSQPEDVDNRGRIVKITGYYQVDNPR